ncbi:MAG: ATPase, T2SS/T4P/T4SS family [bacterium]|nr:ATPase, T2SS/T4P/T4SS family [bacterium]
MKVLEKENKQKEENVPSAKKGKLRLGEMLVERGVINYTQLNEALGVQKKRGERLACILVELGIMSDNAIADFLSKELGIPRVKVAELNNIHITLKNIIPENIIRRELALPISKQDNTLVVAMVDPLNVIAIDELSSRTGFFIKTVIATELEIKNAIEKHYGKLISMDDLVKKMASKSEVEVVKEEVIIQEEDLSNLIKRGTEPSIVDLVNYILVDAIRSRASDIHIEPGEKSLKIRNRIDGVLYTVPSPPKRFQNSIVSRIKILSGMDIAEHRLPQDGRFKVRYEKRDIDFRVSVIPTTFGEKAVLRILDASNMCVDLEELGFEPKILPLYKKYIKAPHGIILVTGPTGCGKSTTLYSTLRTINSEDKNILTVEDPIEYLLPGINQVQVKPEIGLDFIDGLRSFLRQDPDVIMVGEIRDREAAEVAINAALTGHLVFSTLHTNDAAGSVTRLLNMGIEPFLISSTVLLVIAQRLVRKICPDCRESYEASTQTLRSVGIKIEGQKEFPLYRGRGCDKCNNIGYKGRIGVYEAMIMNDEIRQLILMREPSQTIKESAEKMGMISLKEAALKKVIRGTITLEEMLRLSFEESIEYGNTINN